MVRNSTLNILKACSVSAIVLTLAAWVHTDEASAQRGGRDAVGVATIYVDADFRGGSSTIDRGIPDLSPLRLNDLVSSIRVEGLWQVCTDAEYRGTCVLIDRDVRNLSDFDLNDRISSLRPAEEPRRSDDEVWGGGGGRTRGLALFADADFRGQSQGIANSVSNLRDLGFNDVASSLRVGSGSWLVCEDADFGGRCAVVDRDVVSLRDLRLDDRISSVRPWTRDDERTYGRDGSGWGKEPTSGIRGGVDGRTTVFFVQPRDRYGDIRAERGAANRFCRDQGLDSAVFFEIERGYLVDVLCAK
jgi:hypothetical protein